MLEAIKSRIAAEMKHGDIADACRMVGVSRTVYETASQKKDYKDLTAKEEEVLMALVNIFNQRKKNLSQI